MELERRSYPFDNLIIERSTDAAPKITGHAAVFNLRSEDLGGFREQILPGAFADAIQNDDVRALWNHNPDHVLGRNVAKTLTLAEDVRGLQISIIPPDTQMARDLMVSIERGDVSQMSFGFQIKPGGQDWAKDDDGTVIRTLKKLRLFDVSPVTFPAYPQTDVGLREFRAYIDAEQAAAPTWKRQLAKHRLALMG